MKKILSLLCALTIVLSASAGPTKKLLRNAKMMQHQELRQKKNFGALMQEAKVQKGEKFAKATALRAPKAQKVAIDVTIGSWEIDDWGTDGELMLYGDDNTIAFYFDIIYGGDNEDLKLGKTYTIADIYSTDSEGQYAGIFHDSEWHYGGLKELSLTKTIDVEGLVHFAGSVVDSADVVYTFHYDEEALVPTGDTITYFINANAKISYSSYFGDWAITADDGKYALRLDILSENDESPVGSYTSEDFDLEYTWVEEYTDADSTNLIQAYKAEAVIVNNEGSLSISSTILGENGVVYILSANYVEPKKESEATITATNLVVDDTYFSWFGIVLTTASNADFSEIYFSLSPESESYYGTYTIGNNASGSLTTRDSLEIERYSGTVTLAQTEDGITMTGKVLCYNNVEYTLNLTYVKPEKTREEAITIDGLGMIIMDNSAWQIYGYSTDSAKYVSIAAYAAEVAGTYTEADLAADYSYIVTDIVGKDGNFFDLVSANLTVAYNAIDSVATVTGTFLGQNGADVPLFTLNLTAKVLPAEGGGDDPYDTKDKAFKEVFDAYEIDDQYLAEYGDLIVKATNENGAYIALDIYVAEGDATLTPGTYTFSKTEEPMTVYIGSSDGQYIYYSFFTYLDEAGNPTDLWFAVDGTLTINEQGVIEIDAVNSYGAQIQCRIGAWPEAIDNTEVNANASKTIRNGQLIILKNGTEYNAQGAMLK